MSAERDALAFFELLYGPEPPGRIVICTPTPDGKWPTHTCVSPVAAVPYVVGVVDAFHRVTLVERKPKSGRGKEADTSALTAVWLDVDVNGSPDGKGGVVTGAAPSREAALDLLHSVLQPSFVVASGHGAHGYWRLDEPLRLRNDDDRQAAKRLVRGWHERIKRNASDLGMPKFDSVFDLARVLRPVGSLNGKGGDPVPVELLDDGGPVYALADIEAEAIEVSDEPTGGGDDQGSRRSAEELTESFPQLGRIARREGKAPRDPSPSGWDHWLACEGVRCGLSDHESKVLLRHGRPGDPKLDRDDYVRRTIAKARASTKAEASDPARRISNRWNIAQDPIVGGSSLGDISSGSAIIYLDRRSGKRLRLPNLGDLFEPRKHTRVVSTVTRSQFTPLTTAEAVDIAQSIIKLCGGEDADPREEARQWVIEFIAEAGVVIDANDATGERKGAWDLLDEYQRAERHLPHTGSAARRSAVIKGKEWWLPAGAIKEASGSRMSWGQFTSSLAEIGWRHEEIDLREPASRVERASGQAGRIHRNFYVGEV